MPRLERSTFARLACELRASLRRRHSNAAAALKRHQHLPPGHRLALIDLERLIGGAMCVYERECCRRRRRRESRARLK